MGVTLESYAFDDTRTTVEERIEEVGGRDARVFVVRGLLEGFESVAAMESDLDAIAGAASKEDYSAALSMRAGRRYWVRRARFVRDVFRSQGVGSFELVLEARDPFEEAVDAAEVEWAIAVSGATRAVMTHGNADALLEITLAASGDVVRPSFGDGVRRIAYGGTVEDGRTLVIDGVAGKVRLDGEDVTAYCMGEFPVVAPGGTTLMYEDDALSSHTAAVVLRYRDRWW